MAAPRPHRWTPCAPPRRYLAWIRRTPAGVQALRGSRVALQDANPPPIAPPATTAPFSFCFSAVTDDFAATSAYFHYDGAYRLVDGIGFNVATYFDGTAFPVPVDHQGFGTQVNAAGEGNAAGNGIGEIPATASRVWGAPSASPRTCAWCCTSSDTRCCGITSTRRTLGGAAARGTRWARSSTTPGPEPRTASKPSRSSPSAAGTTATSARGGRGGAPKTTANTVVNRFSRPPCFVSIAAAGATPTSTSSASLRAIWRS